MPTTTFVLLRHGRATHNIGPEAYCDPAHADAALTHEGIQQAYDMRASRPWVDCDAVYCSPLRRCRQTLRFGVPGAERMPVVLDDRLMEPQGVAICNQRIERRELALEIPMRWSLAGVSIVNPWDTASEGISVGDSSDGDAAFEARVQSFTEELLARHPGEQVLVVSHHDWIQVWCRQWCGENDVSLGNCEWVVRAVKT